MKAGDVCGAPAAAEYRPSIQPADVATIGSGKASRQKRPERKLQESLSLIEGACALCFAGQHRIVRSRIHQSAARLTGVEPGEIDELNTVELNESDVDDQRGGNVSGTQLSASGFELRVSADAVAGAFSDGPKSRDDDRVMVDDECR